MTSFGIKVSADVTKVRVEMRPSGLGYTLNPISVSLAEKEGDGDLDTETSRKEGQVKVRQRLE